MNPILQYIKDKQIASQLKQSLFLDFSDYLKQEIDMETVPANFSYKVGAYTLSSEKHLTEDDLIDILMVDKLRTANFADTKFVQLVIDNFLAELSKILGKPLSFKIPE